LEPGDEVLADKGFPGIKTECENNNSILVIPPILYNCRFSKEEVLQTYSVAIILPEIDNIMHICCVLTNLQSPIIKQN